MITLTDSAASKVKQLLEAEGATDLALRVAVRPGGCSGFSYEMFFDGDVAADDQTLTFGDVRVVVDEASSQLLTGASLDYQDGLQDAGFKINNRTQRAVAVAATALAEPCGLLQAERYQYFVNFIRVKDGV